MSLLDDIKKSQLQARKERNTLRATLLTTLIGEAAMVGKNEGRETTDAETVATVKKFIKNASETLRALNGIEGGQAMIVNAELAILREFMPAQMTDLEIEKFLANLINAAGATKPKMGDLLKELKAQRDGQYDGAAASRIAKALLA